MDARILSHHLFWWQATRALLAHGALAGLVLGLAIVRQDWVTAFVAILMWFATLFIWNEWRTSC